MGRFSNPENAASGAPPGACVDICPRAFSMPAVAPDGNAGGKLAGLPPVVTVDGAPVLTDDGMPVLTDDGMPVFTEDGTPVLTDVGVPALVLAVEPEPA